MTGNTAGLQGGGLYSAEDSIQVYSTIVAGNQGNSGLTDDIFGDFVSSFSSIGEGAEFLAPLADNGGPTFTHALLPDSPAIDAGRLSAVGRGPSFPQFDQRGAPFSRLSGGQVDIGSYERQALNLLVDTLIDESDGDFSQGDLSLREAIELTNANPVADTIDFDPALADGTILLTQGDLVITDDLTIRGLGAQLLTIDASGNDPTPDENNGDGSRVFSMLRSIRDPQIDVVLSGLTLTGGDSNSAGGAISSSANLTIEDAVIHDNASRSSGGGISFSEPGGPGPRGGSRATSSEQSTDSATPITLRILRSTISNNVTIPFRTAPGGGLWIGGEVTAEIVDSTIANNRTLGDRSAGGGIGIGPTSSSRDEGVAGLVTLIETTVSGNSTFGERSDGGGISSNAANLTIIDSEISGNSTNNIEDYSDGGGLFASDGVVEVVGTRIIDNTTLGPVSWGGGFRFRGSDPESSFTMTTSTVSGNSTIGEFGPGGGAHIRGHHLAISDSTFSDNHSTGDGGGISIFSSGLDPIVLRNLTISGNRSTGDGGGLYIDSGEQDVLLAHSTLAFNTSDADDSSEGSGGGVFISSGDVQLDHTIVAGNSDNSGVAPEVAGIINSSYSLVGFGAEYLAPLADNGGLTFTHALLHGSPAINSGDPELFVGDEGVPPHDQRGAPFTRVAGGRVDLGAYEVQRLPLPGDYNLNGTVDAADYTVWRDTMGQTGPGMPADGDNNERIDQADYVIWKSNFGVVLPEPSADSATVGLSLIGISEAMTLDSRATSPTAAHAALVDAAHELHDVHQPLLAQPILRSHSVNDYTSPRSQRRPHTDSAYLIDHVFSELSETPSERSQPAGDRLKGLEVDMVDHPRKTVDVSSRDSDSK